MLGLLHEDQITFHFFFFNNVHEAISINGSLAFLIKRVNDVSFSCRYNAWQLQSSAQGFEDRHNTVIGSRKKLTSLVVAANEACLETPLQHLLPATLRMKLLQLLQLQIAPE